MTKETFQKMKTKNFLKAYSLIFKCLALLSEANELSTVKCFPSYGSCTRLEDQLLIDPFTFDAQETLYCNPLRKNIKSLRKILNNKSKQICLHVNTTNAYFGLENGIVEQASFLEVSDLIRQYSFRKIQIYMTRVKGFKIESPLIIDVSNLENIDIFLDASLFEFVDNNGKRVQACADFERLNTSSRGFFFQFSKGLDGSASLVESNQTIYMFNLEYVRFAKEPICELVFKNMRIQILNINYLIQTFFKTNVPRFIKTDTNADLNSNIEWLNLYGYNADLIESMLPYKVKIIIFNQKNNYNP